MKVGRRPRIPPAEGLLRPRSVASGGQWTEKGTKPVEGAGVENTRPYTCR